MRLLVSVRSALEANEALAGGADIIDAKDPARGSLGSVLPDALLEISETVPADQPFSIALGDMAEPSAVEASMRALALPQRRSALFLKLGFAGVPAPETISTLVGKAVSVADGLASRPQIVAVAYADTNVAGVPSPERIIRAAHGAGAAGVLVDTYSKGNQGLFRWLGVERLCDLVDAARAWGLLTCLAGELGLDDVEAVKSIGPDVMGVRGAACDGGRQGRIKAERVRALLQHLAAEPTPCL